MWNYLKGLIHSTRGLYTSLIFAISGLFFLFLVSPTVKMGLMEAFCCALAVAGFFGFNLAIDPPEETRPVVPYWGEKFGTKQCIRLLAEDRFKPYVDKEGDPIEGFEVSESGRWFKIASQYYPTYLVFDYDPSTGELTMVDGAKVYVGGRADNEQIKRALEEYINGAKAFQIDNEYHLDITPDECAWAFEKCAGGNYKELAKADWDEFRYIWELTISNLAVKVLTPAESEEHAKALENADFAGDTIFTRALLDKEIQVIADAISSGSINDIEKWFQLDSYKSEICVSNGIKILKAMGYPNNSMGTPFLFDCLRDIQKPYFMDAVLTLEKLPYHYLIAIIEQYVEKTHATEDVLWGAGLIYLSKRIGYEISLERKEQSYQCGTI